MFALKSEDFRSNVRDVPIMSVILYMMNKWTEITNIVKNMSLVHPDKIIPGNEESNRTTFLDLLHKEKDLLEKDYTEFVMPICKSLEEDQELCFLVRYHQNVCYKTLNRYLKSFECYTSTGNIKEYFANIIIPNEKIYHWPITSKSSILFPTEIVNYIFVECYKEFASVDLQGKELNEDDGNEFISGAPVIDSIIKYMSELSSYPFLLDNMIDETCVTNLLLDVKNGLECYEVGLDNSSSIKAKKLPCILCKLLTFGCGITDPAILTKIWKCTCVFGNSEIFSDDQIIRCMNARRLIFSIIYGNGEWGCSCSLHKSTLEKKTTLIKEIIQELLG